ncbi:F-box protein At5g07610-like [Arachis ipaensis]|uniref:F-box protein At5g07610-like n=1 Tax=Arachis ipaensis TaxID=130454 RepID=UPI0007AF1358|nr:F-box protein At5g07610-like [Arachis ipaensis]XP_025662204.1 F-box protein At5g07610-like [Arachis hypogaea]
MEVIEGSDALLTEILVRLPLRDVITFKRVSKRWLSLISEPYFSRRRATVQGTRFSGLIVDPDAVNPQHRELTFFYFNKKIRRPCRRRRIFCPKVPDDCSSMLQSCNGLMLLRGFGDTFIYNPTTGDKKRLLSPFPLFDKSPSPEYSLAFDPLRFLGYKLICIFRGKSSKEDGYQTMIYSSESGAWKQCGSSFSAPLDMDLAHGVYFKDSVFYWIGNKSKTTLRFDLKTECVKDDMPPLPPAPQDLNIDGSSYLDDLKRPLKLAYNGYGYILAPACGYMNLVGADFDFGMRVFRLKEDDYSSSRSWVLMHSFDLRRTTLKRVLNTDPAGNYSILHLIKDGEDDDEMALFVQIETKVIALRLKDHTRYDVFDFDLKIQKNPRLYYSSTGVMGWYRAFEYVESLACL